MAAKLGGKKGGKYNLGQNADINVTPFVDVMLVLLIIFMVSAPPSTLAIKIDLPPAIPNPAELHPKKPTYISIHEDGKIMIVDTPTTLDTLTRDLSAKFEVPDARTQTILIRADRLVRYKDFMSVVNTLQTNGFYKVALINEDLTAPT
jgi:biopolymer transport protein ExbD